MTGTNITLSARQIFTYIRDAVLFQIQHWHITVLFIAAFSVVMTIVNYAFKYTMLWMLDLQASQPITLDLSDESLNVTTPLIGLLLFFGIKSVFSTLFLVPWFKISLTSRVDATGIHFLQWSQNHTRFLLTDIGLTLLLGLSICIIALVAGVFYSLGVAGQMPGLTFLSFFIAFALLVLLVGYFLRLNLILPALTQTLEITLKDVLRYTKGPLSSFILAAVILFALTIIILVFSAIIFTPVASLLPVVESTITIVTPQISFSEPFLAFSLMNFLNVFLLALPSGIVIFTVSTVYCYIAKHFMPFLAE